MTLSNEQLLCESLSLPNLSFLCRFPPQLDNNIIKLSRHQVVLVLKGILLLVCKFAENKAILVQSGSLGKGSLQSYYRRALLVFRRLPQTPLVCCRLQEARTTGDLAPKAKVLRCRCGCRHRHAQRQVVACLGVAHQWGGMSKGGWHVKYWGKHVSGDTSAGRWHVSGV